MGNSVGKDAYTKLDNGIKIKGDYKVAKGEDGSTEITGNGVEILGTSANENIKVFGNNNTVKPYGGSDKVSVFGNDNKVIERGDDKDKNKVTVEGNDNVVDASHGTKIKVTKGDGNWLKGGDIDVKGNQNVVNGTSCDDNIKVEGHQNFVYSKAGDDNVEVTGSSNVIIDNDLVKDKTVIKGDGTNKAFSKMIGENDVFNGKENRSEPMKIKRNDGTVETVYPDQDPIRLELKDKDDNTMVVTEKNPFGETE